MAGSRPSDRHVSTASATLQDLAEGIRYTLLSHRMILMVILLASVYTFAAGAYTTLFPVFGKKMLALGPVVVVLAGLLDHALVADEPVGAAVEQQVLGPLRPVAREHRPADDNQEGQKPEDRDLPWPGDGPDER